VTPVSDVRRATGPDGLTSRHNADYRALEASSRPAPSQVAGRFAADGFSSLALDLLSEEGGTVLVFGGADHAFFNDTGPRFNPPAAAEAYRRVIDWFDRNAAQDRPLTPR
jgi:Dienelactone hydrolase family